MPSESIEPLFISGYVNMSAQLAEEAKRIAEAHAAEVAAVGEILAAYFREVADD